MNENNNQFLGSQKIGSLMMKYSVPCVISLLVGALYNIVDQIFIANADYLGSFGNAANTVVFPLTVIALGFAVMIGDGCCAFVSLCLGRGRTDDARSSVGNAITVVTMTSIIISVLYIVFADPIVTMFGATVNQETFLLSKQYFFWISIGVPLYMFGQALNPIIRADGNPQFAMVSVIAGAVTNIILDPIFIFALRMGMTGAAVATIIGQGVTAATALYYVIVRMNIRPTVRDFIPNIKLLKSILSLGLTSLLAQISLVAAMAAINNMIRKYSAADPIFGQAEYAQIPMAVVGIVMKVFQIVISVAIGMAAGCIPIVGYNMGAGLHDRVRHLFSLLLICEASVGFAALIAAEVLPMQLITLFGAANESVYYTDFAVKSFRIYLCMVVLACVNKAAFIFLQAMGKAIESTLLSMIREIIFGVGFALLLPIYFGLDGVLFSMPVSDILTAIISAVIIFKTYAELKL